MNNLDTLLETPHVFGIATVSTTDLNKIFGFIVSIPFLTGIGLTPAGKTKRGAYWSKSNIPIICTAIQNHLEIIKQGAEDEQNKD